MRLLYQKLPLVLLLAGSALFVNAQKCENVKMGKCENVKIRKW